MLLDFRDKGSAKIPLDRDGFFDGGQPARRKPHIDYGAVDRDDTP
jgi:hypothetical protein